MLFQHIQQLCSDPMKSMLWRSMVHFLQWLYIVVHLKTTPPEMQPSLCISGKYIYIYIYIYNLVTDNIMIRKIWHKPKKFKQYLANFKSILLFSRVYRLTNPNKHFSMCVKYQDILCQQIVLGKVVNFLDLCHNVENEYRSHWKPELIFKES